MNERRELDDLDRRIDQALRRRFEPPGSLAALPARALGGTRDAQRLLRLLPWLLAAAAAAGVAALVHWKGASDAPARDADRRIELASAPAPCPAKPVLACRPVGPLEPPSDHPEQVHSPDLQQLYATMDACQRSAAALPCSANDDLAERLVATYGSKIELRPDAVGFLQGPFASADWPTATILTGSTGEQTSVLVAERNATLDCCLCMNLPEQSGLRMFTWKVGELVLTEITPLAEPQLLELFE